MKEVEPQQVVTPMEWSDSHMYKWTRTSPIPHIKLIGKNWVNGPRKRTREGDPKEYDGLCNYIDSGGELCKIVEYLRDPIEESRVESRENPEEPMDTNYAAAHTEELKSIEKNGDVTIEMETDELEELCRQVYSQSESYMDLEMEEPKSRPKINRRSRDKSNIHSHVKVKMRFPVKTEKTARSRFLSMWREPKAEIPLHHMPPNPPTTTCKHTVQCPRESCTTTASEVRVMSRISQGGSPGL